MFKQLRDGWNAPKIARVMRAADYAIAANEIRAAEPHLREAADLIRQTTMQRTMHIQLITSWGLMAFDLEKRGYSELSALCADVSKLLQVRFDAGSFYRENP